MIITEILVPAQETAWLPWAVQYFFYIGSAYGAAILFTLSLLRHRQTSPALRSSLALVLAISAAVGPLALTAELHQPGRAWHFFAHLTPSSWMSRGAVLLPLFSLLAVLTAWLYLRPSIRALEQHPNSRMRRLALLSLGKWPTSPRTLTLVALITVISGLSVALYTGAEVAAVASRPLWHQPASPLLWFVTAFLGTSGLTLLMLSTLSRFSASDASFIRRAIPISALLSSLLFPLWLINGQGMNLMIHNVWRWRIGGVMALLIACFIAASRSTLSRRWAAALGLLSIAACWFVRWVTLLNVQSVPRYDAGLYPYALDWGTSGVLGIVGMAGLWLALAVVTSGVIANDTSPSRLSNVSTVQGDRHE
ncbi:tetrathionate reductase [Leminorella grimontii]|uniref:Tetrathionate reductase n=1 Tax=Leminorella grimontii TaxID=82981 RepID=A0AAV5N1Y5_9GAMM|nr:NrfD/PsrC family molybdoenzyme membrane anchor subunit [Leminorella grimontii]KFC96359.1 tetrathionate reductase subunit C [Leminorella grimontii ATCC 33999 = DSM 5078]GKX54452.1 tetrathionate reductase [Leminorella grimontii]VFS59236.1 tetrathionate reductase subunit C [Leminorella grimontii]